MRSFTLTPGTVSTWSTIPLQCVLVRPVKASVISIISERFPFSYFGLLKATHP